MNTVTHLYAGSQWLGNAAGPIAETACGLRKAYVFGKLPSDVVDQAGRVTCPDCRREYREMVDPQSHNGLSRRDFSGQEGKKAQ